MKTGLIIGRYQPIHITHAEVFAMAKYIGLEKLIVIKGSSEKYRMPRHPFTPYECVDMVEMYLKRTKMDYEIFPIPDVSQNIKSDSEKLTEQDLKDYVEYAKMLISKVPRFDVAIVGNPTIAIPLQKLGYETIKPESKIKCTATYIRREYTLHNDRCEDLLLPEQVKYMDEHGLYKIMKEIGKEEFKHLVKK